MAVGDFDGDQVLKQISEAFGAIKNGAKPPPVTEVEPPQEGERGASSCGMRRICRPSTRRITCPNIASPDAYALEIASEILSDGKSSRLYKELVVDKQMVVDVGAGYDMTSFDPGLFWSRRRCVPA